MTQLNRYGVSEDFCAQCAVSMMCDLGVENYRTQYTEAASKEFSDLFTYITKMRAWAANDLGVTVHDLVDLETSIGRGASEESINRTLAAWSAPIRLNKSEWLVLDTVSGLEKVDLDLYIEEHQLELEYVFNYGTH